MGKVKLSKERLNYIERPVSDPKTALEQAIRQVHAEWDRRAYYLIRSTVQG